MQITDVRVKKVNKEGKMKAVVSITIDNEFVVHDIKVIEGDKGLFIAMPSKKASDGEYRDIAHPINSETRDRIQKEILEKYEIALSEEDQFLTPFFLKAPDYKSGANFLVNADYIIYEQSASTISFSVFKISLVFFNARLGLQVKYGMSSAANFKSPRYF